MLAEKTQSRAECRMQHTSMCSMDVTTTTTPVHACFYKVEKLEKKQINIRAESLASYLRCVMQNSKDTMAKISSNKRSPGKILLDFPSILNAVRDAIQ